MSWSGLYQKNISCVLEFLFDTQFIVIDIKLRENGYIQNTVYYRHVKPLLLLY
jgi:hypothetical protein